MSLAAGALTQVSVGAQSDSLSSAVATGGTGPYTYQWYRSTTGGFSPGSGNLISGATALTLNDTGLIPNTIYYYKVIVTDTGHSNDTATSSQLAVTTTANPLNPNQFAQTTIAGIVDQRFADNTHPVMIDATQATALVPGQAVKIYDSADGVPKVVACSASSDDCCGFINFDGKNQTFAAGYAAEMSMGGNCIYLWATAAIARFAQVQLDVSSPAAVAPKTGSSGAAIVGIAYDKATAGGQLIRVLLQALPAFTKA